MNPPIRTQINKNPIIPPGIPHSSKRHKNVTRNIISFAIHVLGALFNIITAFLGGEIAAVPLAVNAEHARAKDGVVPGEGIGDYAVADAASDAGSFFIGYDDYLVVSLFRGFVSKKLETS